MELNLWITIFNRTNKGISVSKEGEEFLSYARQMFATGSLYLVGNVDRALEGKENNHD